MRPPCYLSPPDVASSSSAGPASSAQAAPAPSAGPRTLGGGSAEPLPEGWGSRAATGSSARSRGGGFSAGGGRGGIATLGDLNRQEAEDEGDDERGPANLFTGGERSGLSVQNPDFRRDEGGHSDAVREILRQAAQGARRGQEEDDGSAQAGAAAPSSFGGRGRTIGGPDEEAPATLASGSTPARSTRSGGVPGGFGPTDDDDEEDEEEEPIAIRHLTFWQDGFSIERGPLHRYDDPATQPLLDAIRSERAPLALFDLKFGQRVEIRVAHRMQEKYSPQLADASIEREPPKPFGGQGNRLGSPAPALAGASSASGSGTAPSSSSTTAPSSGAGAGAGGVTPANFQIDDSQPTTQVQIRLADGSRLVGRFNHTHTIADLRTYINASQPGMSARSYVLQASFPPKPLTEEGKTIKEAGLVSSVVIQKWT